MFWISGLYLIFLFDVFNPLPGTAGAAAGRSWLLHSGIIFAQPAGVVMPGRPASSPVIMRVDSATRMPSPAGAPPRRSRNEAVS